MSRPTDFTEELADVSQTVDTDVDAIIKLVRNKDAREGEPTVKVVPPSKKAAFPLPDEPQTTKAGKLVPSNQAKRKLSLDHTGNKASLTQQVILENVTTRLRRNTNALLTEAALRQKLKKVVPATRQDIIEAALQDWFRRHNYSGTDESVE